MSFLQIGLLVMYAIGMSTGQLLFKFAAQSMSISNVGSTRMQQLLQLGQSGYFIFAMLLYLGLSVLWVWMLTFVPLTRAYPFVALAFVFTPLLGSLIFAEPLTPKFYMGLFFVIIGLIFVIRS